jgi:hypothetical protein
MARKTALMIAGAALVLAAQGMGEPARALPLAPIRMHMQHMPRPHAPRPKPPPTQADGAAKPQSAPSQQFHGLMAAAETDVRTRLGTPDVVRAEGSGAMWTYSLPNCALYIFFKTPKGASAAGSLHVSGAAAGPRVRGQRPLPVNDCIAEAMTRQGGGAS